MQAAIYGRKSTEQRGSVEAKSTTRQVENGTKFATEQGWTVDPQRHVFVDDAISGAEFDRRPGLQRMLAAARRREFSVLIVSERKTLGREMFETSALIKQLALLGVKLWAYADGRCLTPRNTMEKLLSSVESFSDEAYRTGSAQRVHEGQLKHVELGHVVGGRLYGYKNRHVYVGTDNQGNPVRSHVVREVNPAEAAVVVRIFEMHAAGVGIKLIARRLTADGVPPPRYTPHGDLKPLGAWSPGTVKSILDREEYRGVAIWNRRKKRDDWGQVRASVRAVSEVVRREDEALRIVPEELWLRASERREDVRKGATFASGRVAGRPKKGGERNLLAGLASCAKCGGGLVAEGGRYVCGRRRQHGDFVCGNGMRLRMAPTDEAVLRAVEEHVLTPERVEDFLLAADRADAAVDRAPLEREAAELERSAAQLVRAVEAGGDVPAIVSRLKEVEARREALRGQIEAAQPVPRLAPEVVESRLAEWRRLLRGDVHQARAVLQRVVDGRIRFTPLAGLGAEFEARTRFSRLFAGFAVDLPRPSFIPEGDERGTEALADEGARLEAAYEELLRQAEVKVKAAMGKGVRPWRDSNPRSPP